MIRTQIDGLNEQASLQTALDCSDMPDMARQEFKDESDVNKVLARYGIDGIQRPVQYSEVDYDLDLQKSLEAIREAERAIAKLPPELRTKYNTWEKMFAAAYSGELPQDVTTYYETKRMEEEAAAQTALEKANPPV